MVGASSYYVQGQEHLTRDGLIKFAEHFGELGAHHGERDHIPSSPQTPEGYPDVLPIQSGEKHPGAASEWHSDATWSSRPPMGSILICREAPPIGGDTNFCDGYSLWEGVHPDTKERVKDLKAIHVGSPHHAWTVGYPRPYIRLSAPIQKQVEPYYSLTECLHAVSRKNTRLTKRTPKLAPRTV